MYVVSQSLNEGWMYYKVDFKLSTAGLYSEFFFF